jgi:hypothetical protein
MAYGDHIYILIQSDYAYMHGVDDGLGVFQRHLNSFLPEHFLPPCLWQTAIAQKKPGRRRALAPTNKNKGSLFLDNVSV